MRKGNIKMQMHKVIQDKLRIGESKHEAKHEWKEHCQRTGTRWNPAYSPYIHSVGTADSYKQTVDEFGKWLKESKPEVWGTKDLASIDKTVAYEYLQGRQEAGCSAWTTSKDMAALNKVLELGLNKKEGELSYRRGEDITRSRTDKLHDSKVNLANYKEQVDFAKAFGCRRESIVEGQYAVKDISVFERDGRLYASLIEKGGRYREAPCLRSLEDRIRASMNERGLTIQERGPMSKSEFVSIYQSSESKLFDRYPNRIDNHSFRHEYAKEIYKDLTSNKIAEAIDRTGKIDTEHTVKADYKGYDKELLKELSQALGHNRVDVTLGYLK
jgi:hypothetical protein